MRELVKLVSNECGGEQSRTQLRCLGLVFLNHREVSAQEAVYGILSLSLKQMSRKVIFINTGTKEDRVSLLKPIGQIQNMDENSEDIYQTSLIDRYVARPDQLNHVSLLSLLTTRLVVDKSFQKMRLVTYCPQLRMEKIDEVKASNLRMTFDACTNVREKPSFSFTGLTNREPSKVYRSKMMLYLPWRDENSDLQGGYMDFRSRYEDKRDEILENERKYSQNATEIDEAIESMDHPSMHGIR